MDALVHLKTFSEYSLKNSILSVERIVELAKKNQMRSVALTDYHTMAGFYEFAKYCREASLNPLFGAVVDCVIRDRPFSLTLLVKNQGGLLNLNKCLSKKSPLTAKTLKEHSQGLIALSGGLAGELYSAVKEEEALVGEVLREQKALFEDGSFGIELCALTQNAKALAEKLQALFPSEFFVAVSPIGYAEKEDWRSLLAYNAMQSGKLFSEEETLLVSHFLSLKEYEDRFHFCPQARENASLLASRCHVTLPKVKHWPKRKSEKTLQARVWQGAKKRYSVLHLATKQRIKEELAVIEGLNYGDYFVLVADIVAFAKEQGIPVGPGRGSSAASVVAFCLGITELCPLNYGLVFERFLNPVRKGLPDIDLDFCYLRRAELFPYIEELYGSMHVAHISTHSTFQMKSLLMELGRAFALSPLTVEALTKDVTEENALSLLSKRLHNRPIFLTIIKQLLGLKRYRSVHAAGLVVSEEPLVVYTGVITQKDRLPTTMLTMESLESCGHLKVDILGLRTLTLLEDTEQRVRKQHSFFHFGQVSLSDPLTYERLSEGRSFGVFQLESSLFQRLLQEFRPDSFRDLINLIALGRPGPMKHIPTYVRRKKKLEHVTYPHPSLEPILKETEGLMIFQEQVITIAHTLGGLSLGEADILRRSMSKKDSTNLLPLEQRFLRGAMQKGLTEDAARSLFQDMQRFAGYAFNKAHSSAYALLTFKTAYFKARYPACFFVSLLTHASPSSSYAEILQEMQEEGIHIRPPDIRFSSYEAELEGEGVRLGLAGISGVGRESFKHLRDRLEEAPFESGEDFKSRVPLSALQYQNLILSGALDFLGTREALFRLLVPKGMFPKSPRELLEAEKEQAGYYHSNHPIKPWLSFLSSLEYPSVTLVCGEIASLSKREGRIRGRLRGITRSYEVEFLAMPLGIAKGEQVALFGVQKEDVLRVEVVLPLRPMLLIRPDCQKLPRLQSLLLLYPGKHPVILYLEQDSRQILPETYWVLSSREVEAALEEEEFSYNWVDPWKERGEN